MNKMNKKIKASLLAIVACATLAVGVACGGKDKITLKFEENGGAELSNVVVKKGEEVTLPVPERAGYKFEGWYKSATFEGLPIESVTAEGNVTYYAKWTQLFAITLDLNGGTLSTTTVYAESGANVYDAVKDYVPAKDGLVFGAWFNGDKELAKNLRLTEAGITLTAQYKVEYTVEVYVQGIDNDEYAKSEELTFKASDYIGATVNVDTEFNGLELTDNANGKLTGVLSATATENLFKAYFDRNVYTLTFNPNYPYGDEGEAYTIEARYGAEVEIPADVADYFREGYCMLGWSTGADSDEITYAANLDALLYNGTGEEAETQKITLERTTVLYGVWREGATDIFGGDDYIYAFEGEENVVYLARGSMFFKGEYQPDTGLFYFYDYTEDEFGALILRGKLFDNGKYLYNDGLRAGSSILYVSGVGVDENVKLRYDSLNGVTYTVYGEGGLISEESTGTYEMLSEGEYCATFTEGPLAGKTIYFLVGTISVEGQDSVSAFQVRNDEEYELGKLYLSGVMPNNLGGYTVGQMDTIFVELDGFGRATYTVDGENAVFNYIKNDNGSYSFSNSRGEDAGSILLTADTDLVVGKPGYLPYDKKLDRTFELEDGGTLTLNGACSAVYEKDGKTVRSYYLTKEMPMGGTLIELSDEMDGYKAYKFLVYINPYDEVSYSAKSVLPTYAEYYYKNEDNIYYAPMLVLDEEEEGYASVYGYTEYYTFAKIAKGAYVLGDDGLYYFTKTESFDEEVIVDPIDFSKICSFVFVTDELLTDYSVHFWYSSNDGEEDTDYAVTYKNGDASLTLVGGYAFYKSTSTIKPTVGTYGMGMGFIVVTDVIGQTFVFELNSSNMTFQTLEFAPYIAYLLQSDNISNTDYYLMPDGKGGATYYVMDEDAEGGPKILSGTATKTGEYTELGSIIYKFESEDGTESFEESIVVLSEKNFYVRRETLYAAGRYISKDNPANESLTIDGFCYKAWYKKDGETLEGNYYVNKEGVIVFLKDGKPTYIDIQGNNAFTVKGEEKGLYTIFENGLAKNVYFEFDGYGKLSVFTLKDTAEGIEREYIAEEGSYTMTGEDLFTIVYSDGTKMLTYFVQNTNSVIRDGDGTAYYVLMNSQELDRQVLVDTTDWAVLILDVYGNATKYNAAGQKVKGSYTMITEHLLYFINADGTDACIYDYDMETGAASPIELSEKTYYTTDLKSLVFSKYGFAVFNGDIENLIFYYYEGDDVIIYRRPYEGEDYSESDLSEYGFLRDNFGKLEDTKEYNGETYYRSRGSDIVFERKEENVSLYPIPFGMETVTVKKIQFAPGGGLEFSVMGLVDLIVEGENEETGEKEIREVTTSCYVAREIVETESGEQTTKMYVLVEGYFRLYITTEFSGNNSKDANNVYEACGLQFYQLLYSARYLDVYYRTYAMYGAASANAAKNEFGTIELTMDYDEKGEQLNSLVTASFAEGTELLDTQGNRLETIDKIQCGGLGGALYYVIVTMPDGYNYRLYFGLSTHPYMGISGYYIYAFVREQSLTVGDYTLTVGRVLDSEMYGIEFGSVMFMDVQKKGSDAIGACYDIDNRVLLFKVGDTWYCVDRKYDEESGKMLSATYYVVTLTENADGSVSESGKQNFPTYKSATLEVYEAEILCEEEHEERYVEIIDGEVILLSLYGNTYFVKEGSYDEATQTYTVTTTENRTFTIKRLDGYVLIEEI